MKRLLVFATVVVMAVMVSGLLQAQSDPFSGTWKFNTAKSKYTAGAPPKEETITTVRTGDQDEVTITGTSATGMPISTKYALPVKGGAGKISEGPYDAVSGKVMNDNTREISYMKGGQEILHVNAVVSKDGKTMRGTLKGTDAQGKPVSGVSVFEKQ